MTPLGGRSRLALPRLGVPLRRVTRCDVFTLRDNGSPVGHLLHLGVRLRVFRNALRHIHDVGVRDAAYRR